MTMSRLQHIIPAALVFLLAAVVTWLSFTEQPPESFLFPRVISVAFIILAFGNLVRSATGMSRVGDGIPMDVMLKIAPGLIIMAIYVFFAAKELGFYVSSWLAFFSVYSFYDPVPISSVKDWIKRVIITTVFMAVIYGLFALVLQVQTPRGLFI